METQEGVTITKRGQTSPEPEPLPVVLLITMPPDGSWLTVELGRDPISKAWPPDWTPQLEQQANQAAEALLWSAAKLVQRVSRNGLQRQYRPDPRHEGETPLVRATEALNTAK